MKFKNWPLIRDLGYLKRTVTKMKLVFTYRDNGKITEIPKRQLNQMESRFFFQMEIIRIQAQNYERNKAQK